MRDLLSRLFLAATVSALLGALLVPVASGWSTSYTCTTTNGVCVSIDDNNGEPRAVTSGSDSNYNGDEYPNSSTTINDTVSSVRNAFTNRDITFSTNPNGGGSSFCQDSGTQDDDLGWFGGGFDDQLSSHSKSGDDSAC